MVALIKALQVIAALSVLIFIHELGHFFWAKLFRIRVEKFYLFFDLGGLRLAHWKWGETEFGIGWLPLGGYCKISGMVDESMDLEQLKRDPQEWEFRTHPAWQRLLVMAGGVLNNFIFAIAVFCCIAGIWGESYVSNRDAHIYAGELAVEMGFRTGDRILSLDGYVEDNFGMLQVDLARRDVSSVKVLRGTDTLDIYIDRAYMADVISTPSLFDLALPFVVDSLMSDGANAGADIRHGDKVTAIDGRKVEYVQDSHRILSTLKDRKVDATVVRGADTLTIPVKVDSVGRIGVWMVMPEICVRNYDFAGAVAAGFRLAGETVSGYVSDLKMLARPSTGAYKSVGSFIAIGQVFPASWDWHRFLSLLSLLSIMLGVMNLIPIPGLDGGHILFTLFEMVTGQKPSERFLAVAQMVGMVLLVALMVLAFGNDIGRLIQ